MKVGGGSQPIRTKRGWFLMYHGVYRTFWALLDLEDPSRILRLEDEQPVLEANPELTRPMAHQMYLPNTHRIHHRRGGRRRGRPCMPITHMPKALFA